MGRRRTILFFFAVSAVCAAPFLRAAGFGFVNCDDYSYRFIPQIEAGLGLRTFLWGFTFLDQSIWMPLTWCSYALDVSLFGGTPGGMHLVNVAVHGLCGGLLFLLLASLIPHGGWRNWLPSALITFFWALHPLRVESVAWIASRKDVLSFLFELAALLLWVKHLNADNGRKWFSSIRYWSAFALFVLATMAKPSAMTFPVIALLLDVFVVRTGREDERWRWRQYVPMLAYAAFIAVLAQRAQAYGGAVDVVGAPLWWRILNAVASYGIYLFHTAWPVDLAFPCYCRWPYLPRGLAVGVACVAAVGAFIAWRIVHNWGRLREFRRVDDWALAGLLIFTLAVGPFLGIASFGYHAFADRFTYVPALGLCVLLAGLMIKLPGRACAAVCALFAAALVPLAGRSWYQTGFWHDDERLCRRALQVDGDNDAPAHITLVSYYYEVDHAPERVIAEYEKIRGINEKLSWPIAYIYLISLFETGQMEKGLEEMQPFKRRIFDELEEKRIKDNKREQNLSSTFLIAVVAQSIAQGEYEIADDHLRRLDRLASNYNYCRYLEGVMYLKQGENEKALASFRRIRPGYSDPFHRYRWLTDRLPTDDAEALKILPSLAWKTPDKE